MMSVARRIAIGSIFVVTIVMGDFVTVRLMSGGQSASVGLMMMNAMSLLQYPAAAANAATSSWRTCSQSIVPRLRRASVRPLRLSPTTP